MNRTDEPEPTRSQLQAEGGHPFYPNHVLKEGIVAYLILGLLLTLAILYPLMPTERADPFTTPEGIKPEWYFLPMFQLLKYLPEPIAVGLPGLVAAVVFLLPFLDRSPERNPRRRPAAMAIAAGFLILTLALGLLGHVSETRRVIFGTSYDFSAKGWPTPVAEEVLE